MKTVGDFIKEARISKKYSRAQLEEITKIKKEFLEAIEKAKWENLPDFAVVAGFVKSIAHSLDLNEEHLAALLRRDYPPRNISQTPKPEIKDKFIINPRLAFLLGVSLVVLVIVSYLTFQYVKFTKPPSLEVTSPKNGEIVRSSTINIIGKVDPNASVKVNNQPALIEDSGNFSVEIEVTKDTSNIEVRAISRSGKETVVRRTIKPELK